MASEERNPYRAPEGMPPPIGWWARCKAFFRLLMCNRAPIFADGGTVVIDGIAFFIRAEEPNILYGASPSNDLGDERMKLIVLEAMGAVPDFVREVAFDRHLLKDRKLTVRMVENYEQVDHPLRPDVPTGFDVFFLSGDETEAS